MEQMKLKNWIAIDIEAYSVSKGFGMPAKWLVNFLAGIGAAFIQIKIWLGFVDPRNEQVDLKEDFRKHGPFLKRQFNELEKAEKLLNNRHK